jgi:hypothetical protein
MSIVEITEESIRNYTSSTCIGVELLVCKYTCLHHIQSDQATTAS